MDYFSPRENEIIKIIGKRKLTLLEISKELFKDKKIPLDPIITTNNSVRRIVRKCNYHKLDWCLNIEKINGRSVIKKVSL